MLKPKEFANAFTEVGLGLYVVCRLVSLVAPDFLFNVGQSWFHTVNLESVKATSSLDLGIFILGAVTLAVAVWVSAYSVAVLYNRSAK